MARRRPNGASSLYKGADGYWHGRVTMGVKDDGSPDRQHVQRKTEAEMIKAVRKLEKDRDAGIVRRTGKSWRVDQWLTHWVENIARPSVRPATMRVYHTVVYRHLIPGVGRHRLARLQPEHLEKLYTKIGESGRSPATVHQIHRTVKTALNEAVRRGYLTRNPATLMRAPKLEEREIEPFTMDEARRILRAASTRRNGVRFALALALGIRKGEALALKWRYVDLEKGVLRTPKQLQRQTWQHGCADPHACGFRHGQVDGQGRPKPSLHKTKPCPDGCTRHHRTCPPPCSANCKAHASSCPQRKGGGLREVDVKSRAGRRAMGIPRPIVEALKAHRDSQEAERRAARQLWQEGGWVFTQPNGRPLDPRADQDEWKALLADAGVRDARLHDARHTAATMLLVLKVPARAVMEVMGWSQVSMTTRYQHLAPEIIDGIAEGVEGLLWEPKRDDK